MLQTRLENEQFNTLPIVFPKNRSQNGFITTDRPDSSHLVDLHIYIIPKSVWKNIQHLAENEAMDDAISAGFVRVPPDTKLYHLRPSIENLCGTENHFPRDFIFLRSVGRCLTRVKPTQEKELKVKNYRPPQTLAPEIYLLEGRHEDYAYIPAASPALSSANYLFGNRLNLYDYGRSPTKFSRPQQKPTKTERVHLPMIRTNGVRSHYSSTRRKGRARSPKIDSDIEESSSTKDLYKLVEEQERLRQRQADLERMRLAAEEKKIQSERDKNQRQHRHEEKIHSDDEKHEQRRHEKIQSERKEDERRRQEKVKAEREEEERHRHRRQEKTEAEQRRSKQNAAATKIQASFRGFKDRQVFRERQINVIKNNSRISSSKTNTTTKNSIKNEKRIEIKDDDDDELSDGEILSRSSSIGSSSDDDDGTSASRSETRTIRKEHRESINSSSSSLSSSYSKTKEILHSPIKNNTDDENIRSTTVTKIRPSEEEFSRTPTPDIHDDDTYELERRSTETKRRQKLNGEKGKTKELDKQRQQKSAKWQGIDDPEALRLHLQELRTDRLELEKTRDEIIKHLRSMHHRVTLRRKEARDLWKKKYFHEKKTTLAIEQNATQAAADLDKIHQKIIQIMGNESKHSPQTVSSKETGNSGNFLVKITRTQHESQTARRQIDQAKLHLTTDIKLRNQAENECRVLKQELNQAKMNLNHIKNRKGV